MREEKNKCEWKDGKYWPCKTAYNNYLDLGKPYGPFWNQEKQIFRKVYFCPWCGADIRKPEEIPTIKHGVTTEEAMKAFTDLGKALRKDMIQPSEPWPRPEEKSDWKKLDVNCLPEIINNKCEVQFLCNGWYWITSSDHVDERYGSIIKDLKDKMEYRYRLTPTKKTHEELADEYTDYYVHEGSGKKYSQDEVNEISDNAFIAGRKSMESETK